VRELLSLVGPTPRTDRRTRWFEQDEGHERLERDRALIRRDYPDLKYGLNHRLKRVFLDGSITLRAECGIRTRVKTYVVFGDRYPAHEPMAYETGNMFPHIADRHFYRDGRCCLWLAVETQWRPHEATALHGFLDQVSTFFERQLIHDASPDKRWAWGQRSHDIEGYIELIQEALGGDTSLVSKFEGLLRGGQGIGLNSDCPCESGKKYKYCHEKRVTGLLKQLGKQNPFLPVP
jgi:hypothetical protein